VPDAPLDAEELREPLVMARPEGEEAPLLAVVGPSSGLVGFNLAGLLAHDAAEATAGSPGSPGRSVLFVDAEGYVSTRLLADKAHKAGIVPPYPLCADEGKIPGHCLLQEGVTGLWVLQAPDDGTMDGYKIVRAALAHYDLVIVACGNSTYATQWLGESDRAVVAGSAYLEENVERVERTRGADGSLVVAMGECELPASLASRPIFRLPATDDSAFKEAERQEIFASVINPAVADATAGLARELLSGGGTGEAA
jgi:hypothetical protein